MSLIYSIKNRSFDLRRLRPAVAVFASLLTTQAMAAEQDVLSEIIVTAKAGQTLDNSLVTAHVFTADDIERVQAKDIAFLLQEVSGINITDTGGRGSTTGVFLRGTSSGQTIVLIDGVRVGSATLGSASLNSFPLESIERIEVVKGPLSGIYGADAVGGVIQLFTSNSQRSEPGFGGSASATAGSDSLQEINVALHGGNARHSFYVTAQSEETDGIDRTSIVSGGNDDIDAFEQTSYSFGGRTQISDNTTAQLAVLYSDNYVEFDNTFGDDTGFFTETKTLSSALNVSTNFNDNLQWNTTLGINEDESITPAFGSEFTTERNSLSSEIAYTLNEQSSLTLGLDYYEEEISPADNFPVTDRDNKGVFALYQAKLGKFGFIGNLRYDDNSAYGSDSNASVALDYAINDSVRATASYGTAFVAPSFNFLYFPFFGNPDLLPEESESVELSLRGSTSTLDWRVSAYQTDIENLFSFDPSTFLAANIGRAQIEGIEAEIQTSVQGWTIAANLNLMSAENQDTGVELDDRAQTTFALSTSKAWDKLELRFALTAESDRFDNQGTELSSFALFDVNARYQLNDFLSLSAAVNNLFDRDYTVNLIGPSERYRTEGRQARLKVEYKF